MKKVEFGQKVECKMSKRVGVVYGIAAYLYEADQYYVLFEGEKKAEWITSSACDLLDS